MKTLIIIGAGNIGKILYEYALLSKSYQNQWIVKGFIDNTIHSMDGEFYPPIISTIDDYIPDKNDVFICAEVKVADRFLHSQLIRQKGGEFVNIIHPSANISKTSIMGSGVFIGAFSTISINTAILDDVLIQDHCNIGHDSRIGEYSHLYVGTILCGRNAIAPKVSIYTGSVIYPDVKIEMSATVGAGSVVNRKVKENEIVIGNPAKKIEI